MLDVVFDDSHKGGMMQTVNLHNGIDDVVCISFQLDNGDISDPDDVERNHVFKKLWSCFDLTDEEFLDYQKMLRSDYKKLLEHASQHKSIRIWRSNAPYALCGFAYTCYLLRSFECDIQCVMLPEYQVMHDERIFTPSSWNQVPYDHYTDYIQSAHNLYKCEILYFADQWKQLMVENMSLRVALNGNLISVPESFYDDIIRHHIPDGEFNMSFLVGTVLGLDLRCISDCFIAQRVEHMIDQGELMIVKRDDAKPYGHTLKKV